MTIKERLYEKKWSRPLILSLDILIGAAMISGCGVEQQYRSDRQFDHPKSINIDGTDVGIYDQSEVFDSLATNVKEELFMLELDWRTHAILGYGPEQNKNSQYQEQAIRTKRDALLSRYGIRAEWEYHEADKNSEATITLNYYK